MKVGILGAGGMGGVHARHYRNLPVEVLVFDPDLQKAATLASTHGATPTHSMEELLLSVDAVDICTPSDTHYAVGMVALKAGKPTLIEKPLAHTLEEAEEMVALSESSGVPLMVGQVVRCFPEFKRAHEMVKAGRLGRIAAVRLRRGGAMPRMPWFAEHKRSGGVIIDLGIHELDWLLWTLGPAKTVSARSIGTRNDDQGSDYGLTTVTFQSGAVAHVESTWMDPAGFRVEMEICGSEGMIQYDSRRSASLKWNQDGTARTEAPLASVDDPFFNQLKGFTEAVRDGKPMPVPAREGLNALRLAVAAYESAHSRQTVHL